MDQMSKVEQEDVERVEEARNHEECACGRDLCDVMCMLETFHELHYFSGSAAGTRRHQLQFLLLTSLRVRSLFVSA